MRRSAKALMLATTAMLLLVGTAGLAGSEPESPIVAVRGLQDGDVGSYVADYEGDWRHDGRPVGVRDGPRFEVLDAAELRDADGRIIEALPVVWASEGTTMLPTSAAPVWFDIRLQRWLLDGVIVATQQSIDQRDDGLSEHVDRLDYAAHRDCLLSGPGAGRVTAADCIVPGLHVTLPAGTPITVTEETADHLRLRHVAAHGAVQMDWWYAADLPVPVTFRFETQGLHGKARIATLTLQGFRAGDGLDMPAASVIVAQPVRTAPLEVWGLSDAGIDHPFKLSKAFEAALTSNTFDDLRKWLQGHPSAYVFKAEYGEDHAGRDTVRVWDLHLSDGQTGMSVRISQSDAPHILGLGDVRIERLDPSDLVRRAPAQGDVGDVPVIASVWARWERHVSAAQRNQGANAWGFEILTGADGDPLVHVAGGRAAQITWDPEGLVLLGLADAGERTSLLTMDGDGKTLRFEEATTGPAEHVAAPAGPAPLEVAGYAASAWSPPPATTAAHLGLIASLLGALYLAWPTGKAAALALFSRLRPHELLADPTRATIMDALAAEPGLHFRALCDRLGANPGRIRHHVHKLEQGGLIRARHSPGYTCYFPAATSRTVLDAGPLLRSAGARQILAAARREPGSNSKELAAAAGLSAATAAYHLKRLGEAGLVASRRDGRSVRVQLTPDGLHAACALGVT